MHRTRTRQVATHAPQNEMNQGEHEPGSTHHNKMNQGAAQGSQTSGSWRSSGGITNQRKLEKQRGKRERGLGGQRRGHTANPPQPAYRPPRHRPQDACCPCFTSHDHMPSPGFKPPAPVSNCLLLFPAICPCFTPPCVHDHMALYTAHSKAQYAVHQHTSHIHPHSSLSHIAQITYMITDAL